jgi:hypothetical protein
MIAELGAHDADARIASAEVKDELSRNTDAAIARGGERADGRVGAIKTMPARVAGADKCGGPDTTRLSR